MKQLSRLLSVLLVVFFMYTNTFAQNTAPEPLSLGYQGYLTNLDRTVIDGERQITFRIYNHLTEGSLIWEESLESVEIREGHFNVSLGLEIPLPITTAPDTPLFMSIQVDGDLELSPRLRVGAAIRAQ